MAADAQPLTIALDALGADAGPAEVARGAALAAAGGDLRVIVFGPAAEIEPAPGVEVVDAPAERAETIDAVWRAVESLNPDLKMALLLRDVVGLSYTEIAETLEVTLATVKWRIYKAREEVQLALHRDGVVIPITAAPSARSQSR